MHFFSALFDQTQNEFNQGKGSLFLGTGMWLKKTDIPSASSMTAKKVP